MSFKGKGGVWEAPGLGDSEGGNCPRDSVAPLQTFSWHKEKDAGSGEAREVERKELVPEAGRKGLALLS